MKEKNNNKKKQKQKKNIQIFSPNKSICHPLKTIDYPSGGLFTTPASNS